MPARVSVHLPMQFDVIRGDRVAGIKFVFRVSDRIVARYVIGSPIAIAIRARYVGALLYAALGVRLI